MNNKTKKEVAMYRTCNNRLGAPHLLQTYRNIDVLCFVMFCLPQAVYQCGATTWILIPAPTMMMMMMLLLTGF